MIKSIPASSSKNKAGHENGSPITIARKHKRTSAKSKDGTKSYRGDSRHKQIGTPVVKALTPIPHHAYNTTA